jgi:hypothetical protein
MTKVQLHYDLLRPLSDGDLDAVARAHGVYGIMRVRIAPALDKVTVDYDASRLTEDDVEAALARLGIPIRRVVGEAAP